ncbi:MAG TPA: hypothetical protein VF181_08500 [Balneolaceae bacterium]
MGKAQTLNEIVSVDSLKVGDTFTYSITLDRKETYDEINFPDTTDFGSIFEIRSRKQFKVSTYKDSIFYELQFFGTADTIIPQLPVVLIQNQDTTVLYTNPVPVDFNSVLAENDTSFRPLKPIFEFASAWWPYLLGFIILCIAAYYLYKYYTQNQQKEEALPQKSYKAVPFKNPLKKLQKTIKELERMELSAPEDFKEFYITLGDGIRQYFESLYKIPAMESTSRELLDMLRKRLIDENLIKDTQAVLQEADMVKFAKFTPTEKQADRALKKAYDFLSRAREVDGPRLEHLRREYNAKVEAERKRFDEEQQKEAEAAS